MQNDFDDADLAGAARMLGLDHDHARLAELAPEVARLRAAIRRLYEIDVDGHEMPIGFHPDTGAGNV